MTKQTEENEENQTKWTFYKSGWRPALGWLSVIIIFYAFILHPSLVWYISFMGYNITIPVIDSAALLNLVAIVVGIGAMRTYEKVRFGDKFSDRFGETQRPPFRRRYNEENEEDDIYN